MTEIKIGKRKEENDKKLLYSRFYLQSFVLHILNSSGKLHIVLLLSVHRIFFPLIPSVNHLDWRKSQQFYIFHNVSTRLVITGEK